MVHVPGSVLGTFHVLTYLGLTELYLEVNIY